MVQTSPAPRPEGKPEAQCCCPAAELVSIHHWSGWRKPGVCRGPERFELLVGGFPSSSGSQVPSWEGLGCSLTAPATPPGALEAPVPALTFLWVRSQTRGLRGKLPSGEGDGAPPGGAPFACICGWKQEGHRPPGVPGTRPTVGLRGRPPAAGEGRDPGAGAGAPRLRGPGPAAACGSALRGAPARRALHSPSLHQRLREEGRDPSLAHFPPSQTRTLPRSRSLTPSLSLALSLTHTRAHAAAAPPLAPALPPAPPGRPPGSGLARQPAPGLPPHAASRGGRTRGAPGRSPRLLGGTAPSPRRTSPAPASTPSRRNHGASQTPEPPWRCLVTQPRRRQGGAGGDLRGPSMPRVRSRPLPLQPGAPAAGRRSGPRACPGAPSGAAPRRPR
ncbi:transcription initiation factor TFIID subunit 4-like [Bos taurus]|uniref:transcription initiation factor TFIID subunit 4-like n=1 Tax=Bos taurus TaxID=9913 RepID=UPI0028CBA695|nr:transcription initiation factor TFIID subunit 4-like [Bos taurus]